MPFNAYVATFHRPTRLKHLTAYSVFDALQSLQPRLQKTRGVENAIWYWMFLLCDAMYGVHLRRTFGVE
jgi:hypothetical protein